MSRRVMSSGELATPPLDGERLRGPLDAVAGLGHGPPGHDLLTRGGDRDQLALQRPLDVLATQSDVRAPGGDLHRGVPVTPVAGSVADRWRTGAGTKPASSSMTSASSAGCATGSPAESSSTAAPTRMSHGGGDPSPPASVRGRRAVEEADRPQSQAPCSRRSRAARSGERPRQGRAPTTRPGIGDSAPRAPRTGAGRRLRAIRAHMHRYRCAGRLDPSDCSPRRDVRLYAAAARRGSIGDAAQSAASAPRLKAASRSCCE